MSIEPEDSSLEEALRGDLPSQDTEARLRRRLLAAGLAIGNGVATTTAAAGTAASGTAASGLVAKVVGLSWGVKLGFAAMVAIPTVGLLLEGRGEQQRNAAAVVAPARAVEAQRTRQPAPAALPDVTSEVGNEGAKPEPGLAAVKTVRPGIATEPPPPSDDGSPGAAHPSRADFGAVDAPLRAPQVASTLAEETRLLDGAFAALSAGDRGRASQLIEAHAARYPNGLLQKERERARLRLSEMSRGE
jgi:hypothetical protein